MSLELKLDEGLCRCCHAQGMFQNLSTPFVCQGQEEIYSEMLRECFNVIITPLEGEYSTSTYTICITCALKLRDANEFKKQVLECEERFKEVCKEVMKSLEPMDIDIKVEIGVAEVGDQAIKEEQSYDDDMDAGVEDDYEVKSEESKDETDELSKSIPTQDNKAKGRKLRVASTKGKPAVKVKRQNRIGMPRRQKKRPDDNTTNETDSTRNKSTAVSGTRKKIAEKKTLADKSYKKDFTTCTERAMSSNETIQPERLFRVKTNPQTQAKYYICVKCETSFRKEVTCVTHITKVHLNQKFPCPVCERMFKNKIQTINHLAKVHGETDAESDVDSAKTFQCKICSKSFKSRDRLCAHLKNHILMMCKFCGLVPVNVKEMAEHLQDKHDVDIPYCGICGYKDLSKHRVLMHQRKVHMKEKNLECDTCDMKFFDTSSLNKHMVRHRSAREFECEYCHKKFPRASTMSLHRKIHTGEKDKVCELCGDRFVQKASLNYHMTKRHPEAKH